MRRMIGAVCAWSFALAVAVHVLTSTASPGQSPRPPLILRVQGVEPPSPRAGDSVTIALSAEGTAGKAVTYQFRSDPDADWQSAPEGRARLTNLKPGRLVVEFRAVSRDDRESPIVRRTFFIDVAPRPAPQGSSRFRPGDRFYQVVDVERAAAYRALGLDIVQKTRYTLVSRFTVDQVAADGGLTVEQTVESVHLGAAAPALQGELNTLFQSMNGATFKLTLNARQEVTELTGVPEALKLLTGNPIAGKETFVLFSFLDQDGWKELAQLCFFRPPSDVKNGGTWTRRLDHSWGPLGSWSGKAEYAHRGKREGRDHFTYALDLAYREPRPGGAGLPFEIGKAEFRLQSAAGEILFDPARTRTVLAVERFDVLGRVPVTYHGTAVVIDMREQQAFRVRVLDETEMRALEKELRRLTTTPAGRGR